MYIESTSLTRLMRKVRQKAAGQLLVDNPDYRRTVFLAGTGRSGTTWVADVINYANDYRLMFEPFYPEAVDILGHFRNRQYLRPDNRDARYLEPARTILSGAIRNKWIDRFNRKMVADKRLIKDIRANHLLGWIKANFPEIPIILLLRHPCAVAYSKMVLDWKTQLEDFLDQEELMEDLLSPFRTLIIGAQSDFERHIVHWCVENYVPLRQFRTGDIHLVLYENFCARPEREVARLFRYLGEDFDDRALEAAKRPSRLARKDSPIVIGDDLIESWRNHVTDEQLEAALTFLACFGLDTIYSGDPAPRIDGTENPLIAGPDVHYE